MKSATLSAALLTLTIGCGYTVERNENNGVFRTLKFKGQEEALVVGFPSVLTVTHFESGLYSCTGGSSPSLGISSFGGGASCEFTGVKTKVESIVEATCAAGGCSTQVLDSQRIDVVGLASGQTLLRVKVRLTDGTFVEDLHVVTFTTVDRIDIDCVGALCPGPNAIFVGAKLNLSLTDWNGTTRVHRTAAVTCEPEGVLEVDLGNGKEGSAYGEAQSVVVHARRAGVATLSFRAGGFVRTLQLRVAAEEDVISGHVFHWVKQPRDASSANPMGEALGHVLDVPAADLPSGATRLLVGWALREGAAAGPGWAIGGADRVTASVPGFINSGFGGVLFTKPNTVPAGEQVSLAGRLGSAELAQSFRIR